MNPLPPQSPVDSRPTLAIISGHLTPYRIHFHKRIAREIPELRLATLVTRARTGSWVSKDVPEIGTVLLDASGGTPGGKLTMLRRDMATAPRMLAWLEEHRPAAIVLGGYDELPYMRALGWARRRGVPAFIWADSNAHGDRATGVRRVVKNVYVPRVMRKLAGMMVCGTMGRKFYHRYGVSDDRMFIVPVEPDYGPIETMTDSGADAIMDRLGLARERKRIVVCCRLVEEKRVDLAIDAFAEVAAERPEWDLVIAGEGVKRAGLETRVPADLRSRVRFLGFSDGVTLAGLYRRSQVLLLPSDYEPWGLVVIEGAASGLALLTSDRVGVAYELVKPGENGAMFPCGDAGVIAGALLEATERWAEMGARSREVFARWRAEADPVAGVRGALRSARVLARA